MASGETGIERAARLTAHLPDVETANWYGKPALKVAGKGFAGSGKVDGAIAVHCPVEIKDHLMESHPDIFFETDHYRGWPWVLVRMDAVDDEILRDRLEAAWALKAPAKIAKAWRDEVAAI
jgi:hypothetical protein